MINEIYEHTIQIVITYSQTGESYNKRKRQTLNNVDRIIQLERNIDFKIRKLSCNCQHPVIWDIQHIT